MEFIVPKAEAYVTPANNYVKVLVDNNKHPLAFEGSKSKKILFSDKEEEEKNCALQTLNIL